MMKHLAFKLVVATYAVICAVTLAKPVTLFDFETDGDLSVWHDGLGGAGIHGKELKRVRRFATSGEFSLEFSTPAWKAGMSEWPAFECRPPVTDWSKYDRLVLDLTNTTTAKQFIGVFATDSKHPVTSGVQRIEWIPPMGHVQYVIKLANAMRNQHLNASDIALLFILTERPPVKLHLFIDRICLLQPGDPLPQPPSKFTAELSSLQRGFLDQHYQKLSVAEASLAKLVAGSPSLSVSKETGNLRERLDLLRATVDKGVIDHQLSEKLRRIELDMERLTGMVEFRAGFEAIRNSVEAPERKGNGVSAGFASSMVKILVRGPLPELQTAAATSLSLAGNEWQSLQVAVLPATGDLKRVHVKIGELRSNAGTVFPAGGVKTSPVGYIDSKTEPPYVNSYIGWWPDPILELMDSCDIAKGDVQTFWVRFHAPPGQRPGIYHGTLEVLSDGAVFFKFGLTVRVYAFDLPSTSPLPIAATFRPRYTEMDASGRMNEGDYRDTTWVKHKLEWADFLADYYITYNDLYTFWDGKDPDFEVLGHLHRQGRLGCFNLGYFFPCEASPEKLVEWKKSTIEKHLRPCYEKAKAMGILDHAYIFGGDEASAERFPDVQRAAAILKAEFPTVPILSTAFDHDFGLTSELKSIDAFVPATYFYDPLKVALARDAGKKVWWYIACGPTSPFANMFLECPAIEGRLLMGAMTAKFRPDGFLYYQISMWNSPKPITSGPFTEWISGFTNFHGDGSWVCLGPDGTPLPTIRLENFRDGLEDYAYVKKLEAMVAQVEFKRELTPHQHAWLGEARKALAVPDSLVKSLSEYSRDPKSLEAWRNHLADLIEADSANK